LVAAQGLGYRIERVPDDNAWFRIYQQAILELHSQFYTTLPADLTQSVLNVFGADLGLILEGIDRMRVAGSPVLRGMPSPEAVVSYLQQAQNKIYEAAWQSPQVKDIATQREFNKYIRTIQRHLWKALEFFGSSIDGSGV